MLFSIAHRCGRINSSSVTRTIRSVRPSVERAVGSESPRGPSVIQTRNIAYTGTNKQNSVHTYTQERSQPSMKVELGKLGHVLNVSECGVKTLFFEMFS